MVRPKRRSAPTGCGRSSKSPPNCCERPTADTGFAMGIEGLTKRRYTTAVALAATAALAALCLTPLVGPTRIDFARAFAGQSPDYDVLFSLRLPRVLLAMLAGGALSLAGA